MLLKKWEELPRYMQNSEVKPYYDALEKKRFSLFAKFVFDKVVALWMLVLLAPIFLLIAILIKMDSPGEIMFRQERITQYGRKFRIHKFRTMVTGADKKGTLVTTSGDARITKVGKMLRGCRLDELPQLIDILAGDMSFVGTRPEVSKYVERYTPEMYATLLLPAGVTSEASIEFKNEEQLLTQAENVDECYVEKVLPEKMKWNLKSLREFNFIDEIKTMLKTVRAVIK